mgnify:CR=1 FL=1
MMPALALPGWLHTQAASYASLVLTPFLHEDVAVVVAASYIEGRVLSATQAFSALYLGVVASDLAIFALGRLARTWTPVRRFMPETRVEEARRRLQRNRVLAIASCRLVPGLLFATFSACGFLGIGFLEFLVPALVTSALYTALLLGIGYGPMPPAGSRILAATAPKQHRSLIFSIKQAGAPAGGAIAK